MAATTGEDAQLGAPNHRFDFFSIPNGNSSSYELSKEEQIVQTASKDPNARYNLYHIPALLRQRGFVTGVGQIGGVSGMASIGYARSVFRTPYISAYDPAKGGNQSPAVLLLHAAAHEIAHSAPFQANGNDDGGLHHPRDEEKNPTTGKWARVPKDPEHNFTLFDEQSDRLRLMWARYQLPSEATGRPPGLLLKHEADSLHTGNQ